MNYRLFEHARRLRERIAALDGLITALAERARDDGWLLVSLDRLAGEHHSYWGKIAMGDAREALLPVLRQALQDARAELKALPADGEEERR